MAEASPFINNEIDQKVKIVLNTIVEDMEQKMTDARSMSVDDVEKLLDDACNDCVKTFEKKMEEIKESVKRGKPNPSSSTYAEDQKKYTVYITAVAAGMQQSKNLFDIVFERIRNIISTVLDCLKAGLTWIWEQLNDAFASVKTLLNY